MSTPMPDERAACWRAGAAYVDGRFCPIGEAAVPILDWGFVKSDATYDVVSVWRGRFFRLDDHLDRFARSVAALRMTLPLERSGLAAVLAQCVTRAGLEDAYVSMTLTRGVPPPGSRDPRTFRNRLYAFAVPYARIFDTQRMGRTARLVVVDRMRIPPASVDPRVKNYHWLDLIMGGLDALEAGGDLPVLNDGTGNVTEGTGFNLFAVIGGCVVTPCDGVLEGITRRTVLDICTALGIPAKARAISVDELRRADEIFVTSTAGGVMPVGWLDGQAIGEGSPGAITDRVAQTYWAWHGEARWSTPVRACLD